MNAKLDNILFLVFCVFTIVAIMAAGIWMYITEKRLKKFFLGKKARDLEDTLVHLEESVSKLNKEKKELENKIEIINNKLKKSIRGLETIRFNPFPDQGSNQSFAIGLLDESGDGVIVSSLYSRDRMSIFAKPIKNHKSEYELTEEEKEVLKKAEVRLE